MRQQDRFVEIDLLRTLAVLGMIVYHAAFDLMFFFDWNITIHSGAWWWLARSIAAFFLLIVGISFFLSWKRRVVTQAKHEVYVYCIKRGLSLLGIGLCITIFTYLSIPEAYIRFGILHCIGVSILLLPLFQALKIYALPVGIGIVAAGVWIHTMSVQTSLLLPFGFKPIDFVSVDYFPLLPWFGFALLGYGCAYVIYRQRDVGFVSPSPLLSRVTLPGRYALWVYLLHQPVLLGFLWIVYKMG